MNHNKAVREVTSDPSLCVECGGWKGRKPGTKPYCTRIDCPGSKAPSPDAPSRGKFARIQHDDDEEASIKSVVAKPRTPPPRDVVASPAMVVAERTPMSRSSYSADDSDAPEPFAMPSFRLLLVFAACSMLSVGWARYYFVLVPAAAAAAADKSDGDVDNSTTLIGLSVCTALLLATPSLPWLCALPPVQSLVRSVLIPLIANGLLLANLLALLVLVVEPMLPQPGMLPSSLALCVDVASTPWRVTTDRTSIVGGPCWELGAAYVSSGGKK